MYRILLNLIFGLCLLVFIPGQNTLLAQCPTSIAGMSNGKKLDLTGVSYTSITDIDISGSVIATNKTLDGSDRTTPDEPNNTFDPCFDTGNECTLTFTHSGGTSVCVYDETGSRANPLPIELMHFGVSQTNNKVVATWQTATEINNDFFTLEKSTDLKTWEIISTVQGAGNSNVTLEYSTLDDNPIQGVNYYQLKQTDSDGKFTYSKIASINFKVSDLKDDRLNIFPNPTNGQAINVAMNNMNGMFDLKVINILGEEIYSESNYVYKETGLKSIHFQNKLSSGIYHVIMVSESSITTQSFIVN